MKLMPSWLKRYLTNNHFQCIITGLIIVVAIWMAWGVGTYRVEGMSMFPTIENGDRVVTVSRFMWMDIPILQNSVIILHREGKALIKRVVALPGDHVKIDSGLLYINNIPQLNENNVLFNVTHGKLDQTMGPDQYFVLGDNRPVSRDSRSFGPIHQRQIDGLVILRFTLPTLP